VPLHQRCNPDKFANLCRLYLLSFPIINATGSKVIWKEKSKKGTPANCFIPDGDKHFQRVFIDKTFNRLKECEDEIVF
jgi:hypothetical protein